MCGISMLIIVDSDIMHIEMNWWMLCMYVQSNSYSMHAEVPDASLINEVTAWIIFSVELDEMYSSIWPGRSNTNKWVLCMGLSFEGLH